MTDTRTTAAPNADAGTAARINQAVATARDTAQKALETAQANAAEATRIAGEAIEANLVAVLAGGVLLGAAAAAFLPRTEREVELLNPVAKRLSDSARAAAQAAIDTGKTEFSALGLNRETLEAQAKSLFEGVLGALGKAGGAAAKAGATGHTE